MSTDDLEIANISKELGCKVPFIRPKNISEDNVSGIFPALDAIEFYEDYDWLLLFKSTSPLRFTSYIDKSIELAKQKNVDSHLVIS